MSRAAERARSALRQVTAALANAETRPGQEAMAEAIAESLSARRSLIVSAGTGTGKTLAYLVPAILHGGTTIVATATKALQDQLASNDLPFLAEHLGREFTWAVLKGRSNYLCLQRLRELADPGQGQLELGGMTGSVLDDIQRLGRWAATTATGDLADLDVAPHDAAWRAVSVGSDECPGRTKCPLGESCFSERARRAAEAADVVVVNMHLYGLNIGADGALLPDHDVVILDEAHQAEDIFSATIGAQLRPADLGRAHGAVRAILDDPAITDALHADQSALTVALEAAEDRRLRCGLPPMLADALNGCAHHLAGAIGALSTIQTTDDDARQRLLRAQQLTTRTAQTVQELLHPADTDVRFIGGSATNAHLELAPLDVGTRLRGEWWAKRTAVLTSATVPPNLAQRLGVDDAETLDVGSPFDYGRQALLYCALHLPDPRHPDFAAAAHDELAQLITAAGGRTLALFTSWAAMERAAEAVGKLVSVPIITQRQLPKMRLLRTFAADEATCLFATAGLFQGVDIPGRTLSLVVLDRLPFARPDDPLLSARREALGARAFAELDVPRAATLLAQAAGRLIRTSTDRGVVAVLDRRLGTASYRWELVRALPPMARTRERAEAVRWLREIHEGAPTASR